MNFNEMMDYIGNLDWKGREFRFDRVEFLLDKLGRPEKKMKYVHIAGTNGKGSTAAMLSSILEQAGYKVGLFTSPYIQTPNERIKTNNTNISDEELEKLFDQLKDFIDIMEDRPTEFELITILAFQYFYQKLCDIVILEVGLGGRLDATNVIPSPEVAVITAIGLDHMEELGDTIEKVAYEKAGIIKSNCEVVLYQQDDSVHKIIEKRCKKNVASLHKVDFKHLEVIKNNLTGQTINFEDFKRISFGLLGKFQTKNAAVVLKTIEIMKRLGWDINQAAVEKGMNKTQWPGRFEILDEDKPVIVDGAHNPNGVSELINNIQYYFNNKKVIFIVGFLKDKDYNTMLARVLPFAKHFVLIQPESNRALPTNELAKVLRRKGYENTSEEVDASAAIKKAYSLAEKDTVIIAFGSLYMIGDIKNYFMLTKKE